MTQPALLAAAVLAAGCSTTVAARTGSEAPRQEKISLSNLSTFDVAACGPRALALAAVTPETVIGTLLMGRPLLQECLVDAKARGPAELTQVTVKVTVAEAGLTTAIDGANVTEQGQACLVKAVGRLGLPALGQGAKPVEGAVGLVHVASTSPAVKMGINAASDIVGTVRLAQASMCGCYAALDHAPPPSFKAQLRFSDPEPVALTWEGADGGAAKTLAACLEPIVKALPFAKVASPLTVPYPFRLIDSYAPGEHAAAEPALRFAQLDAMRAQRAADVALRIGGRFVAGFAYDAVVAKYKARPAPGLIPELKTKCQALLASDDEWITSLGAMVALEQKLVTLTQDLSARDGSWASTVEPAQRAFVRAQADAAQADKQRQSDALACPRAK